MARSSTTRNAARLALFAGALYGAWQYAFKPWEQSWGASKLELREPLPGDDLVPDPMINTTRAISIDASMEDVWPWLVQMGQGRAGFYSYDSLSNRFGADIHSADTIMPQYQQLGVGDIMRLADNGGPYMRVAHIEPMKSLVLTARMTADGREIDSGEPLPEGYTLFSWSFYLMHSADGGCRLLVRSRYQWSRGLVNSIMWRVIVEPSQFIMERGMLFGIRDRAEKAQPVELPRYEAPKEERRAA